MGEGRGGEGEGEEEGSGIAEWSALYQSLLAKRLAKITSLSYLILRNKPTKQFLSSPFFR